MTRTAARISLEEFRQKFEAKVKQSEEYEDYITGGDILLTIPAFADLDKEIEFDFENTYFDACEEEEFNVEGVLGYQMVGDLATIGFIVGGDWEIPIYCILYLDADGETFRGYIPAEGNTYNKKTKKAIGNALNDEDDDYEDLGFSDLFNLEKILADITSNIKVL